MYKPVDVVIKFRISLTGTQLREAMVNDLTEGPMVAV